MSLPLSLAEKGLIPDSLIRTGIQRLLKIRLREEVPLDTDRAESKIHQFVQFLTDSPIAVETQAANEQHYEIPPDFFERVLGPNLKYSACLWETGVEALEEAEEAMLQLTARRASIENGQRILDLGCGWGSFSLWAAEKFPGARITSVSNSSLQREFILSRAEDRGLENIEVLTCDMNHFSTDLKFDRIVSIEMLEHLRNYERFFSKVRDWLESEGKFFVHIFCHQSMPYAFEPVSEADWMARYFFSGGIMPSKDLFRFFDKDLHVSEQWKVNGLHYSRTLESWLEKQDRQREVLLPILSNCYGTGQAQLWFQRWRMFFMACSELFRYNLGEEWFVSHYLLEPN